MQWHVLSADAPVQNPDEFEKQRWRKRIWICMRCRRDTVQHFSHIWDSGIRRLLRLSMDADAG